ncbi:hypothetical protein [Psychromonas sp. MME2]|uniref:hypothetical protein n=1 Tax=unclassified Psychromonas TaxID=2614957 RepID=UPI00339C2475
MGKIFSLFFLLTLSFSSMANQTSQIMCGFLSNQTGLIAEQVQSGKAIEAVDEYQELLTIFPEGGPFFQSEVRGFLLMTEELSPDYVSSFFAHACINNYISDKALIIKLEPIIKEACIGKKEEPRTCIYKTLNDWAASQIAKQPANK